MSTEYSEELEYWPVIGIDDELSYSYIDVNFLRFFGHQINNTLQSVTNFFDGITKNTEIDDIVSCVNTGLHITSSIFMLTNNYTKINNYLIIKDFFDKFKESNDITLRSKLSGSESKSYFYADSALVALEEIVSNSREAMSTGSAIDIEFDTTMAGPLANAPVPYQSIMVRDFGCGMSQDTMANLFTGPFTTKEAGAARGLGLSIVDRILGGIGGGIAISSTPGVGTEVELMIPAKEPSDTR